MVFDPYRDVSVVSGPFSVDVNELCAAHTLMTYQEMVTITPARLALGAALAQAELAAAVAPAAATRLVAAIIAATAALDSLTSTIGALRWKIQDVALTYGNADAAASLWETVPGSPMGPQLGPGGLTRWVLGPGRVTASGGTALFHGAQDAAHQAGLPWLPAAVMPGVAVLVAQRDLWNAVEDGIAFVLHGDQASGAQFQRDIGRFALDVNSCPAYRLVAQSLLDTGISQGANPTSTQSASGVSALVAAGLTALGWGRGRSYGIVVSGSDGHTHVRGGAAASSLPPGVFDARAKAAASAMPDAAPDTHYSGAATSADIIEHITQMHGGDAHNGEIAVEEHVTVDADGSTTRSWTVDIRGTQSFNVGRAGPQDMRSNLQGVAGTSSDQLNAIKEAMRAAGIPPGDAVELAGHSQGGIMAAQLAADPEVRASYNVVSVVTAGSPTATVAPSDVPVLAYENCGDIVPGLDGNATEGDNVTTVMFRDYSAAAHPEDPVPSSHSAPLYVDEIRSTLSAAKASSDPGLSALAAAEARRTQALGLTQNTQTTIHHYQTRRITQR